VIGPRAVRPALLLLALGAAPAGAQEQERDTTQAAEPPPPAVVPVPPEERPLGPLSPGSRLVFSRDSLTWTSHYTLAELLTEVPGVYVGRTGFTGQPAPVFFAGRGAAGLEILYDGLPLLPIGPDSVAPDPGRISLFGIRRVEVERQSGFLRVYLISEREERTGARSVLRVVNGDFKTAGYAGLFQYRWANGVGLDLTADYFNAPGGPGSTRNTRWFDLRAQADWTPTPLLSASFQLHALTLAREATREDINLVIPLREDGRQETLLRILASSRPDRLGLSAEAGIQTIAWQADSGTADTVLGERHVTRGFLGVRLADRRASAEIVARAADSYTPVEAELKAGWIPLSWVVLSGGARWARHEGDRTSTTANGSLGVYRGAFSLVGDVRWADVVAAPALIADTAQRTVDVAARAGFSTDWLTLHAGVERRDAFTPPPLVMIPDLPPLPTSPAAMFAVADLTLNVGPLTVSGWFADPVADSVSAFEPPTHSRAALTFRSKFLRTFRSGAFELKVQVAIEAWGSGTAGTDDAGTAVPLPGTSVAEAFLQVELARFHAFYSLKNALRSREGFFPGFEYPRNLQTFGVKWIFRG
jgi:hypothetical protein